MKTKTVIEMDYNELDKLITNHYGKEFCVVAAEEASNDTSLTFYITKEELGEYDIEDLNEFKTTGKYSYLTAILMNDLCNQGIIPEGNYLINICW